MILSSFGIEDSCSESDDVDDGCDSDSSDSSDQSVTCNQAVSLLKANQWNWFVLLESEIDCDQLHSVHLFSTKE